MGGGNGLPAPPLSGGGDRRDGLAGAGGRGCGAGLPRRVAAPSPCARENGHADSVVPAGAVLCASEPRDTHGCNATDFFFPFFMGTMQLIFGRGER